MSRLVQGVQRLQLVGLVLLAAVVIGLVYAAVAKSRTVPDMAASSSPRTAEPTADEPTAEPTQTPSASPTAESTTPASSASVEPTADGPRAVILGDAYSMEGGWPEILREQYGWDVTNLSEDGMGYLAVPNECANEPCTNFRGQVERVAQLDPEIVVLAGGEADGDNALAASTEQTMTELLAAVPDARIEVLSPMSAESPWPYWMLLHLESVEQSAAATGAVYLDTTGIVGVRGAYADGTLTEASQSALATLVAESQR